MLADIGTRRGATLEEVNGRSKWINGHEWMRFDKSEFPVKTAQELKLSFGIPKEMSLSNSPRYNQDSQ